MLAVSFFDVLFGHNQIFFCIHFCAHFLEILYSDLAATMPFGNSVDTFELRGVHLKEVFERAVKDELKATKVFPKFVVQVSGTISTVFGNSP